VKPTDRGYVYWVDDEQMRAFSGLTHAQRFEWVESTRAFLVMAATPETTERILRLRRGETICADVLNGE
jgi:hypothetical protein